MKRVLSLLSLRTPASRLVVWLILTLIIVVTPFRWLQQFSLYKHLGITHAPSIGLTRAYWYVLHGRFDDAWRMNRLIYLVLAIGMPLLVMDLIRIVRSRSQTTD